MAERSPSGWMMVAFVAIWYVGAASCGHSGWQARELGARGVRTSAEVLSTRYAPGDPTGDSRRFQSDGCTAGRQFAEIRFSPAEGPPVVTEVEISREDHDGFQAGRVTHLPVVYLPADPRQIDLESVIGTNATWYPVAAAVWLVIGLFFTYGLARVWLDGRRRSRRVEGG